MKRVYLFSLVFFIIDLVSKLLIANYCFDKFTIINNFFYINYVTNEGAAFSIFSGYNIIFIVIAIGVIIYIHKFLLKDVSSKFDVFSYALLIGGIVGNLFDRLFYGEVIDFLSFKFGSYFFPIFNFADTFICVGVFLIVIKIVFGGSNGISSK